MSSVKEILAFISVIVVLVFPIMLMAEDLSVIDDAQATSESILESFLKNSKNTDTSNVIKTRGIRPKEPGLEKKCNVSGSQVALQIKFSSNSYSLEPDGYKTLDEVAKAIQSPQLKNCYFLIEGHTDAAGDANYNRNLSYQRAETVKKFLVYKNISVDQLATAGLGEDRLIKPNQPYAAENRRVEFRLMQNKLD